MKNIVALILALGFSATTYADNYIVKAKLYEDDKLIGTPSLMVSSAREASVSVNKLYSFALTVTPNKDKTVNVATKVNLRGETFSPTLVVEPGKEAVVTVDGKTLSVLVNKTKI